GGVVALQCAVRIRGDGLRSRAVVVHRAGPGVELRSVAEGAAQVERAARGRAAGRSGACRRAEEEQAVDVRGDGERSSHGDDAIVDDELRLARVRALAGKGKGAGRE